MESVWESVCDGEREIINSSSLSCTCVCLWVGECVCLSVWQRERARKREKDRVFRLPVEIETMIRWVRDDLMTCRVRDMTH